MPAGLPHVLLFPSSYPSVQHPVKGVFYREQAQALHEAVARMGVVYPENRRLHTATPGTLLENRWQVTVREDSSVPIVRLHGWNLPSARLRQWVLVRQFRRLFQTYVQRFGRPDLLHAHTALWGGYAASVVSEEAGIPLIVTAHSSGFRRGLYSKHEREHASKAFSRADTVIAVSQALAQDIAPYAGTRRTHVIPNMVDTDRFCLPEASRSSSPFTLLTVAKLKANKGVDVLLRAFAQAFDSQNDVCLQIGGDGPELGRLRQLAADLGLADHVSFLGLLSREEVKHRMQDANTYVSSSYVETFGIVLVEAMATGIPVVSTRSGGPKDIVTDATGWLATPGNIKDLAHALQKAYAARRELPARSAEIRSYAVTHYSQPTVTREIGAVYQSVIASGGEK